MSKISKLDQHTINSIAAGEVIDRPASVVKELVDNSLDAGAETIKIDIMAGGVREIRVKDDGTGMTPDDALLALESHTTSKLRQVDDLDTLTSMGFRGEALASIAAVSRLTLITREVGSEEAFKIELEGGQVIMSGPYGGPEGTSVTVKDLFYNTPARYKFLKSDMAESAQVAGRLSHLALTRPDVSIQLERDGKRVLHTPGNSDLLSAIYAVLGGDIAEAMHHISHAEKPIEIDGYMTKADHSRNNRSRQVFIVNGRVIRSRILQVAVDEACSTYFMKGRHPALVFHLTIPHMFVDVNVHPQKSEVRFWNDKKVFSAVYHAVKRVLEDDHHVSEDKHDEQKETMRQAEQVKITFPTKAPSQAMPPANVLKTVDPPPRQAGEDDHKHLVVSEPPAENMWEDKKVQAEGQNRTSDNKANTRQIASLLEGKILGQFLNTYIVLQIEDQLVLVDQHAAHERILYERLINSPLGDAETVCGRQALLIPEEIRVTPDEALYIETNAERLLKMGFELEVFGPSTYILRSVPDLAQAVHPATLFSELLAALCDHDFNEDARFHDAFALRACKAAIKANDSLSRLEITHLLQKLQTLENPYHCPHGRPVTVSISKREIEKRFGRIV